MQARPSSERPCLARPSATWLGFAEDMSLSDMSLRTEERLDAGDKRLATMGRQSSFLQKLDHIA